MDKYYWMCWEWTNKMGKYREDDVFIEHPFKAINKKKKTVKGYFTIINYKEITIEEYEMYL